MNIDKKKPVPLRTMEGLLKDLIDKKGIKNVTDLRKYVLERKNKHPDMFEINKKGVAKIISLYNKNANLKANKDGRSSNSML